jgi:hypothetical protein
LQVGHSRGQVIAVKRSGLRVVIIPASNRRKNRVFRFVRMCGVAHGIWMYARHALLVVFGGLVALLVSMKTAGYGKIDNILSVLAFGRVSAW